MSAEPIIYGLIFVGVLVLVEGLYLVAFGKSISLNSKVNRRLEMLEKGARREEVLDKLRKEIEDSWREKYDTDVGEAQKKLQEMQSQYNGEKLASAFSGSKFIKDSLAVPADMAKATFGDRFKIENGKMVAYDQSGNTIYSRKNPGEPADFDEAMSQIVESYQYKDSILKASNHQGTGGDGGGGGNTRTVNREQFQNMKPAEQQKMAQAMREGTVKLVD